MKYLWIEDFDGDRYTRGEGHPIRHRVEQFYQINTSDLLVCTSFHSGLEQIKKEPHSFDAVLLDINLKFSKDPEKNKMIQKVKRSQLYQQYFSDYITEEVFDHYYEKGANGILIYLYLREVACFPKNRIAFLSAFVERKEGGNSLDYQHLLDSFQRLGIVFRHGYMKPDGIDCQENQGFSLMDGFSDCEMEEEIHPESQRFIQEFAKPNGGDYVDFRRNMIELAVILQEEREERGDDLAYRRHFYSILRKPAFHLVGPSGKGVDIYNQTYFDGLLSKICQLPLEPQEDTISNFLGDLLFCGDCFSEAEQSFSPSSKEFFSCRGQKKPVCPGKKQHQILDQNRSEFREGNACTYVGFCRFKESIFDRASISTLKTMRNWLAHGGSGELEAQITLKSFVAPLFLRTVFDIRSMSSERQKRYLEYEMKLLGNSPQIKRKTLLNLVQKRYYKQIEACIREKNMKSGMKYTKDIAKGDSVETLYHLFLAHMFPMSYQFSDLKAGVCTYQVSIADTAFEKYHRNSIEYAYISAAFQGGKDFYK